MEGYTGRGGTPPSPASSAVDDEGGERQEETAKVEGEAGETGSNTSSEMLALLRECSGPGTVMTTDIVLKRLLKGKAAPDRDKVIAVYLFGSRLYGTAKHESDWDFIIVLDQWKSTAAPSTSHAQTKG